MRIHLDANVEYLFAAFSRVFFADSRGDFLETLSDRFSRPAPATDSPAFTYTRACCFPIHFRSHGSQGSARVAFSTLSRYYWDDGLRAPVCRDRIDHDRRGRCIGYHYASDRAPSLRAEYIADQLLGEPLWR